MVPQCTVCSTLARKILAISARCIKVCHRCWVSERQRKRSQATPIASIASIASILPRIPSVRRKDFRKVITDISDITVTSETFEAGIYGRVSLIWNIAQLITTSLSLRKKSVERCLLRSCANVVCFPPWSACGYIWFRYQFSNAGDWWKRAERA